MKKILAFFLLLPTLATFAKDQVYVAYFSTVGTDRHTGVSAAHIFSDYVNEYGVYSAIMPQQRDTNYHVEAISEARESAELLSTTYFVMGQIVRMENVYHVSVSMYAVSSGVIVWNRHESTTSPQDIAIIIDKIAFELGTEKKMSQKGDVFRVTQGEARRIERHRSARSLGVSVGSLMPMNKPSKDLYTEYYLVPGFGFSFSNDLRNFILQLNYNRYWREFNVGRDPGKVSYHNLNIDVLYPLSTTNNAPFVSLGGGYNVTLEEIRRSYAYPLGDFTSEYRTTNLMITGGAGYILRRNANTSLYIFGRVYYLVNNSFQEGEFGTSLNLALCFGRK